jgi:hypothetical protein
MRRQSRLLWCSQWYHACVRKLVWGGESMGVFGGVQPSSRLLRCSQWYHAFLGGGGQTKGGVSVSKRLCLGRVQPSSRLLRCSQWYHTWGGVASQ